MAFGYQISCRDTLAEHSVHVNLFAEQAKKTVSEVPTKKWESKKKLANKTSIINLNFYIFWNKFWMVLACVTIAFLIYFLC